MYQLINVLIGVFQKVIGTIFYLLNMINNNVVSIIFSFFILLIVLRILMKVFLKWGFKLINILDRIMCFIFETLLKKLGRYSSRRRQLDGKIPSIVYKIDEFLPAVVYPLHKLSEILDEQKGKDKYKTKVENSSLIISILVIVIFYFQPKVLSPYFSYCKEVQNWAIRGIDTERVDERISFITDVFEDDYQKNEDENIQYIIASESANLRNEPNLNEYVTINGQKKKNIIITVNKGEELLYIDEVNDDGIVWYQIEYNDMKCWVYEKMVQK